MKFTIGYIDHRKDVFDLHLGPSLKSLNGDFDVISKSDKNYPAKNYNEIIEEAKSDWVILTHQDISFSSNLLECIEITIDKLNSESIKFSALGMVGRDFYDQGYLVHWSSMDKIRRLETCDCCFIVVNKNNPVRFDEVNFDEYHLYVEDYCVSAERIGGVFTIGGLIGLESTSTSENIPSSYIMHHSVTLNSRGCAWGGYSEYKSRLINKWNRSIKTT